MWEAGCDAVWLHSWLLSEHVQALLHFFEWYHSLLGLVTCPRRLCTKGEELLLESPRQSEQKWECVPVKTRNPLTKITCPKVIGEGVRRPKSRNYLLGRVMLSDGEQSCLCTSYI